MEEELQRTIKTLNELIWERRLPWTDVQRWLDQFDPPPSNDEGERLHALFLLSRFTYFNASLMRVLLRSLYRDFVEYPILAQIRKRLHHTLDRDLLQDCYERALSKVRFVGMGNPSESGTHLLYYFRQENALSTKLFVHPHELFEGSPASPRLVKGVKRLIFLYDFWGSGSQAHRYSKRLLERVLELDGRIRLSYYPLFATSAGLASVRKRTRFTDVEALAELDDSFRALDSGSRYFRDVGPELSRPFALAMCRKWGTLLEPLAPLGFGDCQLLLGFAHNIPNNTLPVFWSNGQKDPWNPIFPRYTKGIGW